MGVNVTGTLVGRRSSAEDARIEAPLAARGVGSGEGLCPLDKWKKASVPKTNSIRPFVSIQYRLLADGQMDRQTHDDSIYRDSTASRGKKYFRTVISRDAPMKLVRMHVTCPKQASFCGTLSSFFSKQKLPF